MHFLPNLAGLFDLIKAADMGGGMTAPAAVGGGGQPRSGHKYVSRKWDGGKWQYTYAGEEGGNQGAHHFQFSPGEDMEFTHSVPLTPGAMGAPSPEQAFHHSLHEATPHGSSHAIPHPHGAHKGENINVIIHHPPGSPPDAKMVHVTDQAGKPVQIGSGKGPVSLGNFQKWYRNQRDSVDVADPTTGGHAFTVRPNVGQIEGGMLRPPMNPSTNNKMWMIDYGKDASPEMKTGHEHMQASKQTKGAMTSNTREGALARVKQIFQNRNMIQNPGEQKFQRPENPNKKQMSVAPKEGSFAHHMENGKFQWRDAGGFKKRRFGSSDEERESAIQQVAKEFGGHINNQAKKIGDAKGVDKDAISGGGYAAPGDELHTAIGAALDNYDPTKGSFSGYLASRGNQAGGAGKIHYALRNQANKETEGASPLERTNSEGGTYNVADQQMASQPNNVEDQNIDTLDNGGGEEDADEPEREFGDWHREQYNNLNKINPATLTPEQAQYLPKLKDAMRHPSFQSDPIQAQTHLIGALHKLGLSQHAAPTTMPKTNFIRPSDTNKSLDNIIKLMKSDKGW